MTSVARTADAAHGWINRSLDADDEELANCQESKAERALSGHGRRTCFEPDRGRGQYLADNDTERTSQAAWHTRHRLIVRYESDGLVGEARRVVRT